MATIPSHRMDPLHGAVLVGRQAAAHAGRAVFYAALADVAPRAMGDLGRSCARFLSRTDRACLAFAPPGGIGEVEPIGPCVKAWANRYQLAAPWVVEDAIWALLDAKDTNGPSGGRLLLAPYATDGHDPVPVASSGTVVTSSGTVVGSFAWHFASQPGKKFKPKMREHFGRNVDPELARIEAEATAADAVTWDRRHIDRDMRWLVQRVVLEWRPEEIGKAEAATCGPHARTVQAIKVALGRAAALIDLPLPPAPSGRPRG